MKPGKLFGGTGGPLLQKSTTSVHRADAEALNIVVFICLL
jgi:hypothetical protein